MDSVSRQVMFSFARVTSTVDDEQEPWQLLLRIVADFSVSLEGREFFAESEFTVVEFASVASEWLRHGDGSLLFTSMESEERPLLEFIPTPSARFRAYSPHQCFVDVRGVDGHTLREALASFIDRLRYAIASELAINIDAVL